RAAWIRAERAVLERASVTELGYGDPRGSQSLRTELAGWLARTRGLRADPGDIIVVTGVAQALALLAQVLQARGLGEIAVEDPGSRGARDDLAYWGLRPVPVPVDEHGMLVAELARSRAPAALLTPAHQFPTGVVLAPQRRRDLLNWAAAADGLIVEDDYDAEFRYDRAPVPALHASAPELVAYAGSTSKTLAPGMRLGWLIPPARPRAELTEAKSGSDRACRGSCWATPRTPRTGCTRPRGASRGAWPRGWRIAWRPLAWRPQRRAWRPRGGAAGRWPEAG